MRKLIAAFVFLLPITCWSQAHLGSTALEIKAMYPDKEWTSNVTKSGKKYIMSNMGLGTFIYFFDKTGMSDLNVQVVSSLANRDALFELYNKKYVITSKTSWTANSESGSIMYIKYVFDDVLRCDVFTYSHSKD